MSVLTLVFLQLSFKNVLCIHLFLYARNAIIKELNWTELNYFIYKIACSVYHSDRLQVTSVAHLSYS